MRRAVVPRLAAGLVAVGALAALATPAHADTTADGLWYFDMLNVQAAHDAGFTGEGVTIAVLDTPVNPDIPTLAGADLDVVETVPCYVDGEPQPSVTTDASAEHGTNVVSMIVGSGAEGGVKGVAPDASVLYYAVTAPRTTPEFSSCRDESGEDTVAPIAAAIVDAVDRGADIISMSIGFGPADDVDLAIVHALASDVLLVNALPNQQSGSIREGAYFSNWLNGGVSVSAFDRTGAPQTHVDLSGAAQPNTDVNVDVAGPGLGILYQGDGSGDWSRQSLANGTSFATPVVAGFLAVVSQKYPEATSNQLIQTLIRNTGSGDHELSYDEDGLFGYGFASLTSMLRVDPTQYEDVNPLFTEDGSPLPEQVDAAREALAATPTPTPEPGSPDAGGFGPVALAAAAVGGLVVIAGLVVLTVILVRRRARG